MKVRRDQAQRREVDIIEATTAYLVAAGSIDDCLAARDHRINELRRQIEQIEAEHEIEVSQWRDQQARAVAAIRDLGETEDQIADLLGVTNKHVRHLLAITRAARRTIPESVRRAQPSSSKPGEIADPNGATGSSSANNVGSAPGFRGQSLA
ncbi:hypothetical protein AB0I35_31510 [Nocardia sp. NPDC050378]|uniref:hypothetical protein n=1 Tax=Nocardia sp. NPDC050378 TaxID=3155400 RepID=UPI003401970A